MQSVSSRIWTRVAVSISCDDNHYTTGTSTCKLVNAPPSGLYILYKLPKLYSPFQGFIWSILRIYDRKKKYKWQAKWNKTWDILIILLYRGKTELVRQLILRTAIFIQGWLWHEITNVGWAAIKQRNQTNFYELTWNGAVLLGMKILSHKNKCITFWTNVVIEFYAFRVVFIMNVHFLKLCFLLHSY